MVRSGWRWPAGRRVSKTAARRPPPTVRPRVEALEGRLLPAAYTVTNLGDSGAGTGLAGDLRYCITRADADGTADTIDFAPGVSGVLQLGSALPHLTGGLTLRGPGAASLTLQRGAGGFDFLTVDAGAQVSLSGLTFDGAGTLGRGLVNQGTMAVTDCAVSNNDSFQGAGIYNTGMMTVSGSRVTGNVTSRFSTRIKGAGILNGGTLAITDSTVANNTAAADTSDAFPGGGGIANAGNLTVSRCVVTGNQVGATRSEGGGGIYNIATATITDSTISGNSAALGGGIFTDLGTLTVSRCTLSGNSARIGGGIFNFSTLTLTDSTFSDNRAQSEGGALDNRRAATIRGCTLSDNAAGLSGGGIANISTLTVVNCTIYRNSAAAVGTQGPDATAGGGGIDNGGALTLESTTVAANTTAGSGGGLYVQGGTVTPHDTLISGNSASLAGPDVDGAVSSAGNNLVGDSTGASGLATTDLHDIDPLLTPLGDNGGPTLTAALAPTSPAVDAGDPAFDPNAFTPALTTDQRGLPYARVSGGRIDIGAYELQPNPRPAVLTSAGSATYDEGLPAVAVDPGLEVFVAAGDSVTGATVSLGGGWRPGEDVLALPGTFGGITASYDPAAGVLTLSGAANAAAYQAALRAVTFADTAVPATAGDRTVTFAASDSQGPGDSASRTVSVKPRPAVSFASAAQVLPENAGAFSLAVTLSAAWDADVTVPFTLGGTAVARTDYAGLAPGTLRIPAGQTGAAITGTLSDDGFYGGPAARTLTVTLGTPANATLGGTPSETLTLGEVTPRPAFPSLTTAERFVQALYLDELGRAGSTAELDGWVGVLNGPGGQAAVAAGVGGSPEARDHLVKSWYQIFLGRQARGGEEMGWVNGLLAGTAEEQVLGRFLGESQFHEFYDRAQTLSASGTADERFVQALYRLLLGRAGSAAEVDGWAGGLTPAGRAGVALSFLGSAEFRTSLFTEYYQDLLHRTADAGLSYWVNSGADAFRARQGFESGAEFFMDG